MAIDRRVPPLDAAIKPETRRFDAGPPVLVLGELPSEASIYATHIGASVVQVLTARRALEHLASLSFRAVAVSPALELVKQVKLATDHGEPEFEEAVARNLLTPFVVLPFPGENEYAVLVVPPEASYVERTSNLRVSAVLFRLDVEMIVRALFRGSS